MFEIKPEYTENIDDEDEFLFENTYLLFKDDIKYNDILIERDPPELAEEYGNDEEVIFNIYAETDEMASKLLSNSIFQFPDNVSLNLNLTQVSEEFKLSVKIQLIDSLSQEGYLSFNYVPIFDNWKLPFSFNEFRRNLFRKLLINHSKLSKELIQSTVETYNNLAFRISDKILYTAKNQEISVTYNHRFSFLQLTDVVESYQNEIFRMYQEIFVSLKDFYEENLLKTTFDFPDSIKSYCQQYLQYFARFLQDLGIDVNSSIKEEAGKVLFSVKPTDETLALDKIREALSVYLNLPSSPIVYDDSFAAMRLQQQIENLQHSQKLAARELQFSEKLLAAQSDMLHEKNLTISQLQFVNEQQQKIIEKISSKSVMMDSLENKEKLYEGLEFVPSEALKKYAGVIFQPMSFFKELGKNMLGKDEFTSLDLDKEVEE